MSAEREHIASGVVFSKDRVRVMKDAVFGWVVLQRDSEESEEEAYTVDELSEESFEALVNAAQDRDAFPEELREYLREFESRRSSHLRYQKLH